MIASRLASLASPFSNTKYDRRRELLTANCDHCFLPSSVSSSARSFSLFLTAGESSLSAVMGVPGAASVPSPLLGVGEETARAQPDEGRAHQAMFVMGVFT